MAEESGEQRFCTNCGAQLVPRAVFCASCGTRSVGRGDVDAHITPGPADGPVVLRFLGSGLQLLGTGIIAFLLMILIIPYGWGVAMLSGWFVNNLAFNDGRTANFSGRGSQIWYYIFLMLLTSLLNIIPIIGGIVGWLVTLRIQLAMSRWFFSHVHLSTGQTLRFVGAYWPFVGWYVLFTLSFITIIGWAWVASAWMRWLCRNVDVGEEHLEFLGSGIDFLWRGIVAMLGSVLIITIPWMAVWYLRWITRNIQIVQGAAQRA